MLNFFYQDPPDTDALYDLVLSTIIGNRREGSAGGTAADIALGLIAALQHQAELEERSFKTFDTMDEAWAFFRQTYLQAAKKGGIERDEEDVCWPEELPWSTLVPCKVIRDVAQAEAEYDNILTRELRRMYEERQGASAGGTPS